MPACAIKSCTKTEKSQPFAVRRIAGALASLMAEVNAATASRKYETVNGYLLAIGLKPVCG
jgi:hypothetical protein